MIEETKDPELKPEDGTTAGSPPAAEPSVTAPETSPAPSAPEPKPESKTIEVPVDFLSALKEDMEALKTSNKMLLQVADKRQVARYYQQNRSKLPTIIRIRYIEKIDKESNRPVKKVIIGWRNIVDDVYYDPQTRRGRETQTTELIYEDGTHEEMPMTIFWRQIKEIECKLISTKTDDSTGEVAYELERQDNGERLTIGAQFVN